MAEMKSITLNGKKYEIPEGGDEQASSGIPAYTEADYGKFLSCSAAGLVWATSIGGSIPSAEGVEF